MDMREALLKQIDQAERDQKQHDAMAQQSRDSALVCAGVIYGAKLILAQMDAEDAKAAIKPEKEG